MGKVNTKSLSPHSQIGKQAECPFCLEKLKETTTFEIFDLHVKQCKEKLHQKFLIQKKEYDDSLKTPLYISFDTMSKLLQNFNYPYTSNSIQDYSKFELYFSQFRNVVQLLKKDWRDGSETLTLSRNNIVNDSMDKLKSIDIYKELKINFLGETTYDAGGIIREWITVLCKELSKKENSK
jgi:hypothetical protein